MGGYIWCNCPPRLSRPLSDPSPLLPFLRQLRAQAQGTSEELRCLLLLNSLQEFSDLEDLVGNRSCLKLAGSIKAYVDMVSGGETAAPQKRSPSLGTLGEESDSRRGS